MNKEIIKTLFPKEYARIESGHCPDCNKEIEDDEFDDNKLGFKEYLISGLCINCQNKVFKQETLL
mgnify:CR=1 FL=1